MSKIIFIHSFRGSTGKSNTLANLTALLAAQGLYVGVIETSIQTQGIHFLFGLDEEKDEIMTLASGGILQCAILIMLSRNCSNRLTHLC